MCERNYCMCKYDKDDNDSFISQKEKEETLNFEGINKTVDVDDEAEEVIEQDDEFSNTTFVNPSQDEEIAGKEILKCDKCDFQAATNPILFNHRRTHQNWCRICWSSFKTDDSLKTHIKDIHDQ